MNMNTLARPFPLAITLPRWRPGMGLTIIKCVAFGPLVGGLPYNVFLFPIPFSYLLGLAPAIVGGGIYAWWLHAPGKRYPTPVMRAAFGALFGTIACVLTMTVFEWVNSPAGARPFSIAAYHIWYVLHGTFAGLVLGAPSLFKPRLTKRSVRNLIVAALAIAAFVLVARLLAEGVVPNIFNQRPAASLLARSPAVHLIAAADCKQATTAWQLTSAQVSVEAAEEAQARGLPAPALSTFGAVTCETIPD